MKSFKRLLGRFTSNFKTPLPIGLTAFYKWSDDVIDLTGLPNNDSVKFALANLILQLKPHQSSISKKEVSQYLLKAAANEVAAQVYMDLKQKQAEEAAKNAANKSSQTIEVQASDVKSE